jgi:antitoxin HicB
LETQQDGRVLVSFVDLPEALTEGETKAEALAEASDCVVAALCGYVNVHRPVPRPSRCRKGQHLVELPALLAAKLALYDAMLEAKVSRVALAKQIGVTEGAVRRLLDLDHRSHIGQVETALEILGKRLVVEVHDAA